MTRIKVLVSYDADDLEKNVNDWLEENINDPYVLVDVKLHSYGDGFITIIVYKVV